MLKLHCFRFQGDFNVNYLCKCMHKQTHTSVDCVVITVHAAGHSKAWDTSPNIQPEKSNIQMQKEQRVL